MSLAILLAGRPISRKGIMSHDRVLTLTYFMTISNYVTGFSMRKLKQWIFCKLLQPMIGSWGQVNELMEITEY